MLELTVMGRSIKIYGQGAEDSPFIVKGTGTNPPLAALAEHAMLDHWMGKGNWMLMKSSTHSMHDGGTMAVLTIRTFAEDDELVQADIYFDITEAFSAG
jgi:hypothetical protein